MKKIVKYSKNYNNIISLKNHFITIIRITNSMLKINKYLKNKSLENIVRPAVLNCRKTFYPTSVVYTLCKNCNHLNAVDNSKFMNWLYNANKGKNYNLKKL